MAKKYKGITPEQAHEISLQYINWKPIIQAELDDKVPPAARNGETSVMLDITHPYPDGRFDDELIDKITGLLDSMGWNCSSSQVNGSHGYYASHLFKVNW